MDVALRSETEIESDGQKAKAEKKNDMDPRVVSLSTASSHRQLGFSRTSYVAPPTDQSYDSGTLTGLVVVLFSRPCAVRYTVLPT